MFTIRNHRAVEAVAKSTPNKSGFITPKFIVMHYTAGWSAAPALSWFSQRTSAVSAHLVLDTDGTLYQCAAFNEKTWHAGPSTWKGYSGLNSHAIGIEIVNPGWLKKTSDGNFVDWTGSKKTAAEVGPVIEAKNARVGSGMLYWPLYKEAQLLALDAITQAIIDTYDILDIVSHEEIDTRGWKTDPGPAFPMQRYRAMLGGRQDDADWWAVTASSLNVRSGPGSTFPVTAKLKMGDHVEVSEVKGDWSRIDADEWVHSSFLRRE